jgi:hypothetical protein
MGMGAKALYSKCLGLKILKIQNIQFEVVGVKEYENKNSDFDSPSKSKFLSVLEVNSLSCPFLTIFTKLRFSNESF